ncbi:unnamed protein product [Dicrocoelium dendriticum]|nr:unnamed protein product [Dicrocoelium dendriticum]
MHFLFPLLSYLFPLSYLQDDDHVVIPEGVVGFQAFSGTGHRLDGKQKPPEPSRSSSEISSGRRERGIPNYSYQPGSLTFFRNTKVCATQLEQPTAFKPFEGIGHQLKTKTKPKA